MLVLYIYLNVFVKIKMHHQNSLPIVIRVQVMLESREIPNQGDGAVDGYCDDDDAFNDPPNDVDIPQHEQRQYYQKVERN